LKKVLVEKCFKLCRKGFDPKASAIYELVVIILFDASNKKYVIYLPLLKKEQREMD
jgi:uncharacterized protein YccT (UPF0319 family)